MIETIQVSNAAVCTSGDYERRSAEGASHILDARTGTGVGTLASMTVVAPAAMVADALSTAAFVLGPVGGIAFLEREGVAGLGFSPALERFATGKWGRVPFL